MSGGIDAVNGCLVPAGQPGRGQAGKPGAGTAFRWRRMSMLEYGPYPEAVGSARAHVRAVLAELRLASIVDDAVFATSELMSNAVRLSAEMRDRPPVRLKLLIDPGQVVVEVFDRAPGQPVVTEPAWDATSGRGLFAVTRLATRLTWNPYEDGKIVWCDFWL